MLVKVIVSTEEAVRDSIIRATNNQTTVELTALHATDKIQRDIEDVLLRSGLYYERKTRFYQNQGITQSQIIAPLYIAGGFLNLILKEPYQAALFKSKFMKNENSYARIFSNKIPMDVWPQIAHILKLTDHFLEQVRPVGHSSNDRFLKRYRYVLSLIATSVLISDINFGVAELIKVDLNRYTVKLMKEIWEDIILNKGELTNKRVLPLEDTVLFLRDAVTRYGLNGLEAFEGRNKGLLKKTIFQLDREFIETIFKALPMTPYTFLYYQELAEIMKVAKSKIYKAAKVLKREGRIKVIEKDLFQVNH